MSILSRHPTIPSSLLHLTFNSLQHRQLSLSPLRSFGLRGESDRPSPSRRGSSRGSSSSRGRPSANFGLRDEEGGGGDDRPSSSSFSRGSPSSRGGRGGGGGRVRGGGPRRNDEAEAREPFERELDPPHLAGDDVFDMGEDAPFAKVRSSKEEKGRRAGRELELNVSLSLFLSHCRTVEEVVLLPLLVQLVLSNPPTFDPTTEMLPNPAPSPTLILEIVSQLPQVPVGRAEETEGSLGSSPRRTRSNG